jgi:hypothetical protein
MCAMKDVVKWRAKEKLTVVLSPIKDGYQKC